MACFRKICGKKKKQKVEPVDQVVQKLEDTEALLVRQQEELEKQIEDCVSIAKTNATSNRRASLRALQKKKRLEKNLEQVDCTLTALETQKDALENAKTNAAVLASMQTAGKALKKANIKLDSNKVQILMDNISDQHYVGNEISNAIRKSLVLEVDEDELSRELEQLQEVELNKKQTIEEYKPIAKFPSIPTELDEVFTNEKAANATNPKISPSEDVDNEIIAKEEPPIIAFTF